MIATPSLSDGTIVLDAFRFDDIAAHLAGEDEEHARRFGWHPARSTEETVRNATLGIERIEALVEPDNEASRGVLRRNGFVEEGILRNRGRFTDGLHDMVLYSLLPTDL